MVSLVMAGKVGVMDRSGVSGGRRFCCPCLPVAAVLDKHERCARGPFCTPSYILLCWHTGTSTQAPIPHVSI